MASLIRKFKNCVSSIFSLDIDSKIENQYVEMKQLAALRFSYLVLGVNLMDGLVYAIVCSFWSNLSKVYIPWVSLGMWLLYGLIILLTKRYLWLSNFLGPLILLFFIVQLSLKLDDLKIGFNSMLVRESYLVNYFICIIFLTTHWVVHTTVGALMYIIFILLHLSLGSEFKVICLIQGFLMLILIVCI